MKEFPKGGLIGKTANIVNYVAAMNVPGHAAYTGYFMVLSVFPSLLLLISILRFTTLEVADLTELLEGIFPAVLMPYAERLISNTFDTSSVTLVSVSAVAALWSASRGVYGLLTGLNAIYGVKENRGYVYTRVISVVYTLLFIVMLILTLVVHVFGQTILAMIPAVSHPLLDLLQDIIDLRYAVTMIIQTAFFTALYSALPNNRNPMGSSIPGAVLASVGWIGFSAVFSLYVEFFPRYANIYGSVYAVALSMLWLYFCLSIVFYGGVLNRLLILRKQGKDWSEV